MGRRNKSVALGIAQLVGLLLALSLTVALSQVVGLLLSAGLFVVILLAALVRLDIWNVSSKQAGSQAEFLDRTIDPSASFNTDSLPHSQSLCPLSASELVDQLRSIDWFQFEKVVEAVFRKVGYQVERRGGANPDGGIDLVLHKEGEPIALQCKHWRKWQIGVKEVRELLGSLTDSGIKKGALIILGGYTKEAKALADKHDIEFINERELGRLLEKVHAGNDPEISAILFSKIRICPKCESEMVLRTAKKGANIGSQFWGCSAYPACRYTMPR